MQQQTQISLNFSEIFSINQPSPQRTPIQTLQNQRFSQSFQVSNSKLQRDQVTNQSLKSMIETKSLSNPIFLKHKVVQSATEQISNMNKLMFSSFVMKRSKAAIDVDKITNRLSAIKSCKKIECSNLSGVNLQEEKNNQGNSKKRDKLAKSKSLDAFNQIKSFHRTSAFDRLYFNSKMKDLKLLNLQKQTEKRIIQQSSPQSRKSRNSSKNQKHLKNYVPFYKRLSVDISNSFEKQKIINKHPNLVSQLENLSFKPKLYPSRFNKKVKSRYLSSANKQSYSNDFANFLNSSVDTQKSTLNRSSQIVDRIEQHFFNKMRLIFVSQDSDEIKITHHLISLLSQTQFTILHGFITYIQQHPIKVNDFDYYIRSYFQSLSTQQKIQLRSHQTQSRFKYTQLDQQHKIKIKMSQKSQKKQPKLTKSPLHKTVNNSKIFGDYHSTIQNFI